MNQTPLPVIAQVSRTVAMAVDRLTGNARVQTPLLVAMGVREALKAFQIQSQVMYGKVAWIEVLPDQQVLWAGCWGKSFHFWVATQFGEVVDLNVSVAHKQQAHDRPELQAQFSPPMLWSKEVPAFYRYVPEGVAELELHDKRDERLFELLLAEVREKCIPESLETDEAALSFLNEPILCPGRRILDDSEGTFRYFDRALSVRGIPPSPF